MDTESAELSPDERFMRRALELAAQGAKLGEVPVGAVVVLNGEILGEGFNQPISAQDPTAHAEVVALREAARRVGNYRLAGAELYVTLEPCSMCAGALVHARIARVIYGTPEPKAGVLSSQASFFDNPWLNHRIAVTGPVLQEACSELLSGFFRARRKEKKKS